MGFASGPVSASVFLCPYRFYALTGSITLSQVRLDVQREGKRLTLTLTLGERQLGGMEE